MGGRVIKNNKNSTKAILLLILLFAMFYLFQKDWNNVISDKSLNKEISVEDISSTQMSKAVYTRNGNGATVNFEDVELNQDDVNNIMSWINSTPDSEIIELNRIPSNISAGILIRLKSRKEIRIQYDLEKIFITRTDVKKKQVMYSINQGNLKNFFDKKLRGFYFGEDKVTDI